MVGRALLDHFRKKGDLVTRLVRFKSKEAPDAIYWNPSIEEIHLNEWENLDAVVHLAGDNITSRRWSCKKREMIFLSRCRDTWLLSQVLTRLQKPPKVLFSASAVGFYGDRKEEILTEESIRGSGFLPDICGKWEEATKAASDRGICVIHGRFGAILSPTGGVLKKLLPIFRLGLGGKLGNGSQWMSWIALGDLVRGIDFVLEKKNLSGAFNFTSPRPVRNSEFVKALSGYLHRFAPCRLPALFLKLVFGDMAKEVLLASTCAIPKRLTEEGFRFERERIEDALNS